MIYPIHRASIGSDPLFDNDARCCSAFVRAPDCRPRGTGWSLSLALEAVWENIATSRPTRPGGGASQAGRIFAFHKRGDAYCPRKIFDWRFIGRFGTRFNDFHRVCFKDIVLSEASRK